MALFLLVVELDVIVDFGEVIRRAPALPPAVAGAAVAALCALSALSVRREVADLWLGPRHLVLRRQPIPSWPWGIASLVVFGPLLAPVGVTALFWYGPTAIPAALTWLALAIPTALFRAASRPLAALLSCVVAGAVAAIGQALPLSYVGWMLAASALSVALTGT